jgi:hypothetical protein
LFTLVGKGLFDGNFDTFVGGSEVDVTSTLALVLHIILGLITLCTALGVLYATVTTHDKMAAVQTAVNGNLQVTQDKIDNTLGGGVPWLPLSALPAWSQRQAILPDGALDPQAYNDCGETCCSMIIAGVHGCPVNPGSIRASLGGPSRSGLTTCLDLIQALANYNVASSCESERASLAWQSMKTLLAMDRPAIMLGTWPTPGGALHWMVATAIVGAEIHYINPWGGVRSTLSQQAFNLLYAGSVVAVAGHIHYDMSSHPMPA